MTPKNYFPRYMRFIKCAEKEECLLMRLNGFKSESYVKLQKNWNGVWMMPALFYENYEMRDWLR